MVILENPPDQTRAEGGPDPGSNAAEILPPPVAPGAPAQETPNPPFLPDEDLDQELVTIQAGHPWEALDLRHLWVYRELLYFLMWRDIKVRYKQTVIGVAWTVLQPLMTMMVFAVFFAGPARLPSEGIPYPLFAFAGLVAWTFFSNAVITSSNSLVGNAPLVTKVYFPRLLIPVAAVGARLVDFAISFVVLLGLMGYYRISATWNLLLLPPLVILIMLFALGCGMWLSALNVRYRDVNIALPHLFQFWMFATPIFYSSTMLPERLQWIVAINPLTGIIKGFRSALFGHPVDESGLAISIASTLVLLVYAAYVFRHMEESFADVV